MTREALLDEQRAYSTAVAKRTGAIVALVVYGLIASLGSILFKRTAQHGSATVRLVYGLSGALTGIVFGLFFLWLILVGIRSVGAVADAQVQAHPRTDAPPPSLALPDLWIETTTLPRDKTGRNTVAVTNRRVFRGCSCIAATLAARLKMNLTFEPGHRL